MLFLTDFGVVFIVILLAIYLINKKMWKELLEIIFLPLFVLYLAFLLKFLFEVPRPYELYDLNPLKFASYSSFPSIHASFAISLYFAASNAFKNQKKLLFVICGIIALSRVYIGVHNLSDIIAGGILGYYVTEYLIRLDNRTGFSDYIVWNLRERFEFRRQIFHLFLGVSIVFLLKIQLINVQVLLFIFIIGLIISYLSLKKKIPYIHKLLLLFDREKDIYSFPGKGCIYFILGSLITVYLFPPNIAMAGIMIMSLGDSLSVIIGKYYGRITHPFNRKRKIEGLAAAIFASTLGALFFVPFVQAFIASFTAMFLESFTIKVFGFEIDDNLIVPIVSGLVLSLF